MEEKDKKTDDKGLLIRLFPFVKAHAFLFISATLMVFILTGMDLAIPWFTRQAVDKYIAPASSLLEKSVFVDIKNPLVRDFIEKHPEALDKEKKEAAILRESLKLADKKTYSVLRESDKKGAFLLAIFVFTAACSHTLIAFIHSVFLELAAQRIIFDMRIKLFQHIIKLPYSYFHKTPLGRMVTRLTGDIENLSEIFTSVLSFIFKDLFLLISIVFMLFYLDFKLASVIFIILPFVLFLNIFFARLSRSIFRSLRLAIAEINSNFSESISGISVISLFSWKESIRKRFFRLNKDYYKTSMKQVKVFALFMPLIEILNSLSLAIILYYGGYRVLKGSVSLGVLVAYIAYLRMFFRPMRDIAEKYNNLQNAFSSAERIFGIMDQPLEFQDEKARFCIKKVESIEFSDLSFAYNSDSPVLNKINFKLEKGGVLAIVGPTGAGKSSILSLLLRFWEPLKGKILINGMDLKEIDPESWRKNIAMVMQDPFLFAGSLRENLQAASSPLDDKELEEILRELGCDHLLYSLKDGLDTILSEGGRPLSNGERQLVSIARAFIKNPEVLIMDEATSHVDSISESLIHKAFLRLMEGRTSIIVAHSLSTISHADKILVLLKGEIAERGNHNELMDKKGLYWRMQEFGYTGK